MERYDNTTGVLTLDDGRKLGYANVLDASGAVETQVQVLCGSPESETTAADYCFDVAKSDWQKIAKSAPLSSTTPDATTPTTTGGTTTATAGTAQTTPADATTASTETL